MEMLDLWKVEGKPWHNINVRPDDWNKAAKRQRISRKTEHGKCSRRSGSTGELVRRQHLIQALSRIPNWDVGSLFKCFPCLKLNLQFKLNLLILYNILYYGITYGDISVYVKQIRVNKGCVQQIINQWRQGL